MRPFEHVETQRAVVVNGLFAIRTVDSVWPTWAPKIRSIIGAEPTVDSILGLSGHLADIFRSTGGSGRGQDSLSAGGTAWEALVTWVLNLWLVGTPAIVYKRRSDVPPCVRDALTVTYGTVRANTESDLTAVMYPEDEEALGSPLTVGETAASRLASVAEQRFRALYVAVFQTKTNWNDNAQIPMMWDMLYLQGSNPAGSISVGQNGRHLTREQFKYAFVTVPTNNIARISPTSLHVQRVAHLTGGTYWGYPDRAGVALSLRSVLLRTRMGLNGGRDIRRSLEPAIAEITGRYSYFRI
jgi:hypothetical protein